MFYTNSRIEAQCRPVKPEGIEGKKVYIVGGGLAGMAAAAFLVRDAQMPGENVTIIEELNISGGALDGIKDNGKGFIIRGGREMEEHYHCLWDLFSKVPSLEEPGASVTEEIWWLNKKDPNYSLQRATKQQGKDAETNNKFGLTPQAQKDLIKLFTMKHEDLENKRINQVLSPDFFKSNFWLYWRSMLAFQEWHSALEMKLYFHRFIHHIKTLPDLSTVKFCKYNQYESMALPLEQYLRSFNVQFQFNTEVTDIDFELSSERKQATYIHWVQDGKKGGVALSENDYVFTTIGSLTENSDCGDQNTPAKINYGPAPAWDMWRRIAAKDRAFGHPDVFGSHIPESKWLSATVTTLDKRIPKYIEKICKRDPFSGLVVTGGIVTVQDSAWMMSWTVNRQPHFKNQPKDQIVVWVYGLLVDKPGDYVKKPMQDCTGIEITKEWLYHMGVPPSEIEELASTGANSVPVMMPYVTAFFMPRQDGDRPKVIPDGAVNFAFLGQFAEIKNDIIFTIEYSVRTAMEAVYTHFKVDRGVPEPFGSTYDIRVLLEAMHYLRDEEPIRKPWFIPQFAWDWMLGMLSKTFIGSYVRQIELF